MEFFQKIDLVITQYLNEFAGKYEEVDLFLNIISRNNLVKGGVFAIAYLFFWFQNTSKEQQLLNRKKIIAGFIGCMAAMATARALAMLLPMKLRPLHEPGLNFKLPYSFNSNYLQNQSTFPSDHAGLFFALSAMLFTIHRKTGIIAFLYTIALIIFPRIYLGLHYFSDILAGFIIGITMIILTANHFFRERVGTLVLKFQEKYTGIFYALFFLFIYQLLDLFEELRSLLRIF